MAKQSKTRMGMYSIMLQNLEKKVQCKRGAISTQKTRFATSNEVAAVKKKMMRTPFPNHIASSCFSM